MQSCTHSPEDPLTPMMMRLASPGSGLLAATRKRSSSPSGVKRLALHGVPIIVRSASQRALDLVASALPFTERLDDDSTDTLTIDLEFVQPAAFPSWLDAASVLYACPTGRDLLCRL